MSVLKTGTYEFVLGEWGQTKDIEMKVGFGDKTVACFKQVWNVVGVKPEDYEQFDPNTPATITVFGLIDPTDGMGIEKKMPKIGMDFPRPWTDFKNLFIASGANEDAMGKPEYLAGKKPGEIHIEVKAIPGSGNFQAKNVMVSWRNKEKADAAKSMFKGALSKAADAPAAGTVNLKSALGGGAK